MAFSRFIHIQIYNAEGTQIEYDNKVDTTWGITAGSVKLDQILMTGELDFGQCNSAMFQVQLFGLDVDLSNRKIKVEVEETIVDDALLVGDESNYIITDLGKYIILNSTETERTKSIFSGFINSSDKDRPSTYRNIIAYDWMYENRDLDIATFWNTYWTNNESSTVKTFRNAMLQSVGLSTDTTVNMLNDDLVITNPLGAGVTTLKFSAILSMLCKLQNCTPILTNFFEIGFVKLNTTPDIYLEDNLEGENSKWQDFTTETITGVGVYDSSNNLAQLIGTDTNVYNIVGNIFLLDKTAQELTTIGTAILNELTQIQYTPASLKCIISSLDYELGKLVNSDIGNSYVFKNSLSGSLIVEQTISCDTLSAGLNKEVQDINDFLIQGNKIAKVEKDIDGLSIEFGQLSDAVTTLDGQVEALDTKIDVTASGIIETVSKNTKNYDEENYTIANYGYIAPNISASEHNGDYYLNQSDGKLYVSNGSIWSLVKTLSTIQSSLDTNIQTTANGILQTVSSTYVNNTTYNNKIAELQAEIDGAIETFTGSVVPTTSNHPYIDWYNSSLDDRDKHIGDLYIVNSEGGDYAGFYYRFEKNNNVYSWVHIPDNEVQKALADAEEANRKAEQAQNDIDVLEGTVDDLSDNLSDNYYTKTQTDSQISQTASSITSTVTETIFNSAELLLEYNRNVFEDAPIYDLWFSSPHNVWYGVPSLWYADHQSAPASDYRGATDVSTGTLYTWQNDDEYGYTGHWELFDSIGYCIRGLKTTAQIIMIDLTSDNRFDNFNPDSGFRLAIKIKYGSLMTNKPIILKLKTASDNGDRYVVGMIRWDSNTLATTEFQSDGAVMHLIYQKVEFVRYEEGTTAYVDLTRTDEFSYWLVGTDATYKQTSSSIEQTSNQIVLKVNANGKVASMTLGADPSTETGTLISLTADQISMTATQAINFLSGGIINLTSKNIAITSHNFSVDANGNVDIDGGSIDIHGTDYGFMVNSNGTMEVNMEHLQITNTGDLTLTSGSINLQSLATGEEVSYTLQIISGDAGNGTVTFSIFTDDTLTDEYFDIQIPSYYLKYFSSEFEDSSNPGTSSWEKYIKFYDELATTIRVSAQPIIVDGETATDEFEGLVYANVKFRLRRDTASYVYDPVDYHFRANSDGTIDVNMENLNIATDGTITCTNIDINGGDINMNDGTFHVDSTGAVECSDLTITGGEIDINNGVFSVSATGEVQCSDISIVGGSINLTSPGRPAVDVNTYMVVGASPSAPQQNVTLRINTSDTFTDNDRFNIKISGPIVQYFTTSPYKDYRKILEIYESSSSSSARFTQTLLVEGGYPLTDQFSDISSGDKITFKARVSSGSITRLQYDPDDYYFSVADGKMEVGLDNLIIDSSGAVICSDLTIDGGSININNKFEVDDSGNCYIDGGSINIAGSNYSFEVNANGTMEVDMQYLQIDATGSLTCGDITIPGTNFSTTMSNDNFKLESANNTYIYATISGKTSVTYDEGTTEDTGVIELSNTSGISKLTGTRLELKPRDSSGKYTTVRYQGVDIYTPNNGTLSMSQFLSRGIDLNVDSSHPWLSRNGSSSQLGTNSSTILPTTQSLRGALLSIVQYMGGASSSAGTFKFGDNGSYIIITRHNSTPASNTMWMICGASGLCLLMWSGDGSTATAMSGGGWTTGAISMVVTTDSQNRTQLVVTTAGAYVTVHSIKLRYDTF